MLDNIAVLKISADNLDLISNLQILLSDLATS